MNKILKMISYAHRINSIVDILKEYFIYDSDLVIQSTIKLVQNIGTYKIHLIRFEEVQNQE